MKSSISGTIVFLETVWLVRVVVALHPFLAKSGFSKLFKRKPSTRLSHSTACLVNKDSFWEDISGFSFPIEAGPIYQTLDRCLSNSPHIIGGEPALPREFPHAARLGHRNYKGQVEWFCGGTLISDRHVLTAAHCHYSPQYVLLPNNISVFKSKYVTNSEVQ